MTKWQYTSRTMIPGESWYDVLRAMGQDGWEAWHMERNDSMFREIYFKRPQENP